MEDQILDQLNDSQRAAVTWCDGPQLVIAGAGSGKTRVLTCKIAYLLEHGLCPWNILALTFTNKAAREMKERIGQLVGSDRAMRLQMGTFHSVFARILRNEAAIIGYQPSFTIYDQSDSRSLVKAIIREMDLDDKVYKPTAVADRISRAKNHLILPQAYAVSAWARDDAVRRQPDLSTIYQRYCERCRQSNAMDFDDLLVNTFLLFDRHDDIRQKYIGRFQYVLVDEYQDTNYVQQTIVSQLTKERGRICAVGDDAQSIYGFRGANIDNILNFQQKYPGARLFKLEQNYRSTQYIVEAANSLIRHNQRQIPKKAFSLNGDGERLILKTAYSDREEAVIVCKDIRRIRRAEDGHYSDFAILYRTNAQSRVFEEQMMKDNIPYRIYGGLSFYQRKEIKDVTAYYRLVVNPDDEEALRRVINYPARGIGDTTVRKIIEAAGSAGVSLWTVLTQPQRYPLAVGKATVARLDAFVQQVEGWRQRLSTEDAYDLGHAIIMESGVSKDIYSSNNPDDVARQENLEEFLGGLKDFVENGREEDQGDRVALGDYLQDVALLTDLDCKQGDDNDRVTLMTVHSAKGLEFPTVFVVGLEENIFPSPMSIGSARELEEERRLLYVAITRAERHCILTCAQNRWRYGKLEYDTPSRFIKDIDSSLICEESPRSMFQSSHTPFQSSRSTLQASHTPFPSSSSPKNDAMLGNGRFKPVRQASAPVSTLSAPSASAAPSASPALKEGMVIEHQRFGLGTVVRVEGTGENAKATVTFQNTGTKQLLLKFAKFTMLQ